MIESEQREQARRQNERSVILVNERVMRQEEEQLIDHPPIYTIGERRRDQSNRRIPYEEPITRDPESMYEVQQKSDYLQQSHLQSL